jgi:hypothetical protein
VRLVKQFGLSLSLAHYGGIRICGGGVALVHLVLPSRSIL